MPFAYCPECGSIEYFDARAADYVCKSCLSHSDAIQRTLPEFE
ncbi:hypothetical protein [Halorientalis salina]|nr:hypothetical protein [Halorientalis salina]